MTPFQVICVLITVWLLILIGMMLSFSIGEETSKAAVVMKPYTDRNLRPPKLQDPEVSGPYPGFVPVIGGVKRKYPEREPTMYPGVREYAAHVDFSRGGALPSEFGGRYWPEGSILPDTLSPNDPTRPRFSDAMSSVVLPYRPKKVER